jgi:DNA transposition AAA+ family ATPase
MSTIRPPMDTLLDDARILGASRIIRDIDPSKVTREQAEQVVLQLKDWMQHTGASLSFVARAIGVGTSTLHYVVNLTYNGNWQQIIIDVYRYLEDDIKSRQSRRPGNVVRTSVAEDVFMVADAAIHLRGIGLVWGPSGVGKTMALKAVTAEKPGAVFVSLETLASTPAGVAAAIAHAMRLLPSQRSATTTRDALLSVKDRLKHTPRLLVIDEIHKLCGMAGDKALHVLRDLHDATGSPMIWCGTTDLVAYLERKSGDAREPLAQIRRRIVISRDLNERIAPDGGGKPLYTLEEVRAVFSGFKMRLTPGAWNDLAELANLPDAGHIGGCATLMKLAAKVYEQQAAPVTAEQLRAVLRLMVNRRGLDHLSARLADRSTSTSKAGYG